MKRNILIVEDEMIIALDLKMTLKKNNFDVIGISNSHKQTMETIKSSLKEKIDIDLILMDINISGPVDGIQSCKHDFSKINKIPIIFISAHYEEDTLQMIKDSYAKAYLIKPLKYEELLISIHFILNKNSNISVPKREKLDLKNSFSFNF